MRHWVLLSATLMLAGGCQILSYTWVTPASVAPARVFTMRLTGATDSSGGQSGVVFQVPNAFTVLGASVATSAPSPLVIRDDPALLANYVADPGHHLASFSGMAGTSPGIGNITVDLKVYVQAPPTPGAYQFEMALGATGSGASGFAPQFGLNSFQAPGGSIVRSVQVGAAPAPPPFALSKAFLGEGAVLDLEAADIDRDGRDDIVSLGTGSVTVRRSIPGGFAPGVVLPNIVSDCALADFDGDGFVDIALSTGTVLFGDGGATWAPVVAGVGSGSDVGAGDVDGDGLADLARWNGSTLVLRRGQANRTFVPWGTGLTGLPQNGQRAGVQVVDLDADGRAELVVLPSDNIARVFASTPAGVWSLGATLQPSVCVLPIDVDGNGTKELLVSSGALFTYTSAGVSPAPSIGVGPFQKAAVLDHDRDGRFDVVLGASGSPGWCRLWRNPGAGAFQVVPLPLSTGFEVIGDFTALLAADFDGDTYPDLSAMTDHLLVWHNTQRGAAPFGEACAPAVGPPPEVSVQGSILPGQTGSLQLANALPSGSALLWLGASRTWWGGLPVLPLDLGPIGAPGCTLYTEPVVLSALVADAGGVASVPFAVPMLPPTFEVTLFAQGAAVVPGANAFGAVFSRGLALKIQ